MQWQICRAHRAPTFLLLASLVAEALSACGDSATEPERPPVKLACAAADPVCTEALPLAQGRWLAVYRTHSLATGDGP